MEIKNAVIESATIDTGDRGFLQSWIMLSYGDGGSQGFGGYVLYLPKSWTHHQLLSHAGHWIFRCMEVAGAEQWDKMKGKTVRVQLENGRILGIGHIVKDDWFFPAKDFAKGVDK